MERGSVNRACGGGAVLHNIRRTQLCCVVWPMGEVVPAKLTDVSTCAHQSGFRIRVPANEQIDTELTDEMQSAWIRSNLKWRTREMAAIKCLSSVAVLLLPW